MKLIIQIPCLDEEDQLPATLAELPREVPGVDVVEWLIIDDGSTDRTVEVAREHGVDHIVRLTNNKGLAAAFQAGLDAALKLGADIVVNTDADNQYNAADIPKLIAPIVAGNADMVVGARRSPTSSTSRRSRSASSASAARWCGGPPRPNIEDTTSGFRAYNREAALQVQVVSKFTYTLETIIQAGKMTVAIDHVPIRTNPKTRESRLFPSMAAYVRRNSVSIFRIYALYEPLRVFMTLALLVGFAALVLWGRFAFFLIFESRGSGHVQSLILGAVLFLAAIQLAALGVMGDILAGSRVLNQRILERVRRIELKMGIEPSHYEPGSSSARGGSDSDAERAARRAAHRRARGGPAVSTAPAEAVPTGNTFDKYGSTNPVVRRLMTGFQRALDELWAMASPESVLDVGCGEGVLTHEWAERLGDRRIVGIDLGDPKLQAEWEKRQRPNLEYRVEEATSLSFADNEFDVATAIEVLEHVPDPDATLAEMARVARSHLLVSVPREPLWRIVNMARGAYWKSLGNTPGHVNHWSRVGFVSLLTRHGTVEEIRSPFPWTMLLVRVSSESPPRPPPAVARPRNPPQLRRRRGDPVGADRRHRARHLRLLLAGQPHAVESRLRRDHAAVVGDLHHRVGALPAGGAAAVAHDLRPRRARADRQRAPARGRDHPALARPAVRGPRACVPHSLQDNLLNGSSTLYWILIGAVLGYAASYFARGYLAGHRRFGLYGGLVFMEAMSRCMFALVVTIGIFSGQSVVALGMVAAPLLSLSVVPWALRRDLRAAPAPSPDDALTAAQLDAASAGEPMAETGPGGEPEFSLAHGTRFAAAVLLIMICEQTFLNAGPLLVKATEGPSGAAVAGFVFNVLLIARAPLQLFQAIQTSILPHLTRLAVTGESDPFRRSVQTTLRAVAVFASGVALAFLAFGPELMHILFGGNHHYGRAGLVVVAVGMGLYLSAATLNQAALAQAKARHAASFWILTAAVFVVFLLIPGWNDRVLQVEVGYLGASALLCALLYVLYRRPVKVHSPQSTVHSAEP